jgi:Tol biopolymer transport system component
VVAAVDEVPIYWYRSPDGLRYAFTTSASGEGWHMQLYDRETRAVIDLGPMGSDGPDGVPIEARPDQKSAIDVQWSWDGRWLAFGGGLEPPYTMTVVNVDTRAKATATFSEGYAGEILWSPDRMRLAVSTYDPERTRHEIYIVDPATGAARYLASGCHIVWSPDGRFLAYRGEATQGIGIVDVESGAVGHVTSGAADFPMSWEP